jgi:hypothetical protein
MYRVVPRGTLRQITAMAEPQSKPTKIEPDRYRLGDPGRTDLQDFCEAMLGADQSKVIRAAVAAFILAELDRNEGVRERYEALKRARQGKKGTIAKLVHPGKEG